MARDPAVTFRGALQVLGKGESNWLQLIDAALGGIILASAPIAPISALWGWVDQKNEAMRLLQQGLASVKEKLARAGSVYRHDLIVAAHTVLTLAAFFEIAERYASFTLKMAKITDQEKFTIALGPKRDSDETPLKRIYSSEVPTPSANKGFQENLQDIRRWAAILSLDLEKFLNGLAIEHARLDIPVDEVVAKYRDYYHKMMAEVPEFAIWAEMNEHSATRSTLGRVEALLQTAGEPVGRPLNAAVSVLNRAELDRAIIDVDSEGYGIGATFPKISDIFVSPECSIDKVAVKNLDLLLARHFTSAVATKSPMLLLGHPGAGKSLLMRVLAARLSGVRFTVVRVPLREVDANAPVTFQIDQALRQSTNGRVTWASLSDESSDNLRVILLDGLDELLQATTNDRHSYLQEVAEFQRVESLLDRPVAAIVSARSLVADRLTTPLTSPTVELEPFTDVQVEEWLAEWNRVNVAPNARPMPVEVAMSRAEFVHQPLLLLMLALYYSDPTAKMHEEMSTTELYTSLLNTFAQREVFKNSRTRLAADQLRRGVDSQVRRLSTAALGMFNRGRQNISEVQLSSDLVALLDEETDSGERVLREFFFVHTAQATSQGRDRSAVAHRSYEFLHATFAEYLVASRILETLLELSVTINFNSSHPRPDDDLLFALLSHQPISIQRPIGEFSAALMLQLSPSQLHLIVETLNLLLARARQRPTSRHFIDYQPTSRDQIRGIACYTANLILLRLAASKDRVFSLSEVWPREESEQSWKAMLFLFRSGMNESSYRSVLSALWIEDQRVSEFRGEIKNTRAHEVHFLRLAGEHESATALAVGNTACKADPFPASNYLSGQPRNHLIATLALMETLDVESWDLINELEAFPRETLLEFGGAIAQLLLTKPDPWPVGVARRIASIVLDFDDAYADTLATAAVRHREVLDLIEPLAMTWTGSSRALFSFARARHGRGTEADLRAARTVRLLIEHLWHRPRGLEL